MATVITCQPMRAGAAMPRATINSQQFIECGVMRSGARTPDAKIGSGAQVINVKSLTPAQDDMEVLHGHTLKANLEALNTALKDVHYAEGNDFQTGVFDGVEVVGDELNLTTSPTIEDFEGYAEWAVPTTLDWTARTTSAPWHIIPAADPESQRCRGLVYDKKAAMTYDPAGVNTDVIVSARIYFPDADGNAYAGMLARCNGSGSAITGYVAYIVRSWASLYMGRIYGDGTIMGIGSIGITPPISNQWYRMRLQCDGTAIRGKVWIDGDAEPGWLIGVTNTSHVDGSSGFYYRTNNQTRTAYFDDFGVESIPPAYGTDGEWIDDVDVTAAEHYSHGLISWDEETPPDTTAKVYTRWRDTDAWVQQVSGDRITGIALGDDMRAGAAKDTLLFKVALASTDAAVTAAVSNLRVYFEPLERDAVEIVVHGKANTIAANTLITWGMAWLRPAASEPYVEVLDWSDLWFQSVKRWMARDEQTVAATINYWGNTIESITFEAEASKYRHGYEPCEWVVPALVMASGATLYEWTALKTWFPMGHNFMWNIIDKGQAIHADYRWLVGHAQLDDHPLSFLLAVPNITDHPLSVLAKAYARNDHPLSLLVQGWQRDDFPLSYLVGEWTINDHPVSMLAAIEYLDDHPMSFLVYGVTRDGVIEVNVIDTATWTELTGLGYTRS